MFQLKPFLTKVETNNNYKFANVTASIGQTASNQSLDMNIHVIRQINLVKLSVSYYAVLRGAVMQNALFTRSVDFCDFLERPTIDRLIKIIYDVVIPSSNLPKRCPVLAGHYYVRDLQLSHFTIPSFLPEAHFVMTQLFKTGANQKALYELRLYGRMVRVFDD
ncbi:uncharacterized protein LOC126579109 [Anopheles aquasalis]|uniref:uncharacterized protein LOC126579109 n=1 Tax=Anopheles aquasalis TaxID=42839 RepID=UPI00215A4BA0|nr:uncharacterized protein LOC126579109 [Anopheles aquasalis]